MTRELSDLEYHESGKSHQDMYDALMRAQDEIERLNLRVKFLEDELKCPKP